MLTKILVLICLILQYTLATANKPITMSLHRLHNKPEPGDADPKEVRIVSLEEAKGRGLQQEITKDVINFQDLQYVATLYVGEDKKQMTFIYDTGSTFLWLPLNNCTSCPTNNLYTPTSTFSSNGEKDGIVYGSGSVNGTLATDIIALTPDTPSLPTSKWIIFIFSANFNIGILAVDATSKGIQGTRSDGILGMAPRVSSGDNAQLFVENLAKNNIIPKNAFGVNYNGMDEDSTITLGGYDTSIVANDTLFSWVDLMDSFYWSVNVKETTYGVEPVDLKATRAILDTGTSLSYFTGSDWDTIYAKISEGRKCGFSSTSGFRACE